MRKLSTIVLAGLATFVFSTTANAVCPTWHVLTNGTTANADDVMDNFQHILECAFFTQNVGIGTGTPQFELTVGSGAPWAGYTIGLNGGTDPGRGAQIAFQKGGVSTGWIGTNSYIIASGTSDDLTIASNGNNIRFYNALS